MFTALPPPCRGEQLHVVADEDQPDSVKGGGANDEVSQRTREGLAQLHSSLHLAFCESNVIVARFHALVKLEKEEEARALLENLPDEYAAMLGENQNWLTLIFFSSPR